jgi:antitoxin (DNA-binding transcriptional repressor) of toxin-antitoxin stability system
MTEDAGVVLVDPKSVRVGITRAKRMWDELVHAVESGLEPEIIITRWKKPVARLVPMKARRKRRARS